MEVTPDNLIRAVLTTLSKTPEEKELLETGRLAKCATTNLRKLRTGHRESHWTMSLMRFLWMLGLLLLFAHSIEFLVRDDSSWWILITIVLLVTLGIHSAIFSVANSSRQHAAWHRLLTLTAHWLERRDGSFDSETDLSDIQELQIEMHQRFFTSAYAF